MAGMSWGGAPRPAVPTLEEVAARAGVSRSTASRAINGGLRVSPEALASVERAVADLGYSPNRAARSLVTRRTDSIALVVPEPDERVLSDPFFAGTLSGLSSALQSTDIQMVLVIVRPGDTERALRYLRAGHVDGAIVVSHHRADNIDRELAASHLPTVFVGRPLSPAADGPPPAYVDSDNVAGARLATEHLIGLGRRRIGTIAGTQDMAVGVDRLAGWRAALVAAGLPTDAVACGDFSAESGSAGARRLLADFPDLDAVFVASDLMATGALPTLAELGRTVPDDVAVVAYDNSPVAASTRPPLTSVAQPVVAMARAAGLRLLDELQGAPAGPPLIFAPQLVVRASA